MKIATSTPIYSLPTPGGGQILFSQPAPGSSLALRLSSGHYQLPQPIIGYARLAGGQLALYTAGAMASGFRTAAEEPSGPLDEYFFAGSVPPRLSEYQLDEYAPGDLLYYPATELAPALMIAHVNVA